TTTYSSAAQIERKESDQSYPAPDLQRFLLLTSDVAGTRTRAANGDLMRGFCRAGASPAGRQPERLPYNRQHRRCRGERRYNARREEKRSRQVLNVLN